MATFSGCFNLEYIDTTDKLTYISDTVFYECYKLQMIDISNVKHIGCDAFSQCNSITYVDLPPITELWEGIFSDCSNLYSVNIPDEITYINGYVFENCT